MPRQVPTSRKLPSQINCWHDCCVDNRGKDIEATADAQKLYKCIPAAIEPFITPDAEIFQCNSRGARYKPRNLTAMATELAKKSWVDWLLVFTMAEENKQKKVCQCPSQLNYNACFWHCRSFCSDVGFVRRLLCTTSLSMEFM